MKKITIYRELPKNKLNLSLINVCQKQMQIQILLQIATFTNSKMSKQRRTFNLEL